MPKLNAEFDRKEIRQTIIDNDYCQIYIERVFRIMHKRMGVALTYRLRNQ